MVWQDLGQVFGFNFLVYVLCCPSWLIPSPLRIWGTSQQGGAVALRGTILQGSKQQTSKQTELKIALEWVAFVIMGDD